MSIEDNLKKLNERQNRDRLLSVYGSLLSERQYAVCELYLGSDLTFAEISKRLNCSRQSVHQTYYRAIKSLQKYEDVMKVIEFHGSIISDLRILLDHAEALNLESECFLIRTLIRRCENHLQHNTEM